LGSEETHIGEWGVPLATATPSPTPNSHSEDRLRNSNKEVSKGPSLSTLEIMAPSHLLNSFRSASARIFLIKGRLLHVIPPTPLSLRSFFLSGKFEVPSESLHSEFLSFGYSTFGFLWKGPWEKNRTGWLVFYLSEGSLEDPAGVVGCEDPGGWSLFIFTSPLLLLGRALNFHRIIFASTFHTQALPSFLRIRLTVSLPNQAEKKLGTFPKGSTDFPNSKNSFTLLRRINLSWEMRETGRRN